MFQPILMRFLCTHAVESPRHAQGILNICRRTGISCADVREKDLQSCHPERSRRRSEGSGANKRLEATDSSLTLRMTERTLRMTERTLRMTGIRVACALVKGKAEMCADEMPPGAYIDDCQHTCHGRNRDVCWEDATGSIEGGLSAHMLGEMQR